MSGLCEDLMKKLILIISAILFISCGQTTEQKVESTLERANTYLSTYQCQKAITLLESLGRQTDNPQYLVTLASAYACRASYSSITFFSSDITKSASDDSYVGGLTMYSTSSQTVTAPFYTDSNVTDIQTAIDILLYAGGAISTSTEPTYAKRLAIFSNNGGDINSFATYLILVQLGKFLYYYGDGNSAGLKGGGTGSNTCLTSYGNAPAAIQTAITTANKTGSCTSVASGNSELDSSVAAATRKARLCQGVVLFNNLFELLPFVVADAAGTDLSSISSISTQIQTAKTALQTDVPGIGNVLTSQSQTNCENDATITMANLESYYAAIFETLYK